jgi:hypothetical protein
VSALNIDNIGRPLAESEISQFARDGLLVLKGWSPPALVSAARWWC